MRPLLDSKPPMVIADHVNLRATQTVTVVQAKVSSQNGEGFFMTQMKLVIVVRDPPPAPARLLSASTLDLSVNYFVSALRTRLNVSDSIPL